jgi:hypothetical protein
LFIANVLPFIAIARLPCVSPTNAALYGPASLRREGDYWTLEFDGRICRLRHAKGVCFLAELLVHRGRRIAALDLDRTAEEGRRVVEEGAEEPGSSEKARLNVTRALRLLLRKIAAYHPSAGGHLAASIKTGKFCSYAPDPRLAIDWKVSIDVAPPVALARSDQRPRSLHSAARHGD